VLRADTDFVDMMLLPKLAAAVDAWRFKADPPYHTWLHPWLPLLTSKLQSLYPEVRRKLGQAVSRLPVTDTSALHAFAPWKAVFDAQSFDNLIVKAIVPRLAHAMQRKEFKVLPRTQDVAVFHSVMSWHGVIPNLHLVSILAGEFFPQWLIVLRKWLLSGFGASKVEVDFSEISQWYSDWKALFPEALLKEESVESALSLALNLMQTCLAIDSDDEEEGGGNGNDSATSSNPLKQFDPVFKTLESLSYKSVLEKKTAETDAKSRLEKLEKQRDRDKQGSTDFNFSAFAGGSSIGPGLGSRHSSSSLSFKEAMEGLAKSNGLVFAPKEGRLHEGKPVYQFGACLVVIENNVVYVQAISVAPATGQKSTRWVPSDIQNLLALAT
jgi:tuftelin-interacting protein 11